MQLLVVDRSNKVVLSKSETNIANNADTSLISVGDCITALVDDTDTHNVGGTFNPTFTAPQV